MSERSTPAWDFFVCYAEPDRGWVEHFLLEELRTAGVRCLTQAGLTPGAFQAAEFERAVAESPRVLLVFSAAYRADVNQRLLDNLARYHELENETESVIPLLLDGTPPPLGIRAKVSLRATTDEEKAAVVKRLAGLCQAGPVPPPVVPKCPYPGMAPFDRKDADLFHGRRDEVEELLQVLRHRNYLFLIGRSGSGKSSLVMAGLLPQLEAGRTVCVLRPGSAPRARLEALDWGGEAGRRLLVVDQFEELYTQARPEEAVSFQQALCAWVTAPERMLLVTVRADFYADLQASLAIFPLFQASHRDVLPLDTRGLREAIVEPAARANVFVEPDLVERLLADAADEPGVLPHLQETMQLLWGKLRRRYLPIEAYRELGRDGRTGLQQAMAVVGDAAVSDLPPEELALARRTLLRLVQFGEGRADTRRSQPLSALESAADPPGALDHVLGRLVTRRLVVAGVVRMGAAETTVIDLAHEALIAGWPKLQDWVKEYRAAEQTRRRLTEKAREWEGFGQKAGLLDEVELSEAEQWLARHGSEMGASAELLALVRASRDRIAAERARGRRRIRNTIAGLAAGLLLVSVLAILAVVLADNGRHGTHAFDAGRTQDAWMKGDVEDAVTLLELQRPRPGFFWNPDLRGFEWYHWWEMCHRDRYPAKKHDYEVWAVAFDEDQTLVSVTGEWKQPVVQVGRWKADDIQTDNRVMTTLPGVLGDRESVSALAISPNGRTLAVAVFGPGHTEDKTECGTVTVWDIRTSKRIHPAFEKKFTRRVECLAYSPDGQLLAAGAPDGSSGAIDGNSEVWGTETYEPKFDKTLPGSQALAFDGRGLLAVALKDRTVKLFQAATGEEDKSHGLFAVPDDITCLNFLTFSDDHPRLAAGTAQGEVYLWDVKEGNKAPGAPILPAIKTKITCLALSPRDKQLLAVGSEDHTIRLLRLTESWKAIVQDDTLKHNKAVRSLAFRGDGRLLASGGEDRKVKLWDVPEANVWQTPRETHGGMVRALAFSRDGTQLVTGSGDKTVVLWSVASGHQIRKLWEHKKEVNAVAFTLDGRWLASGSADGEIKLGDVSDPTGVKSIQLLSEKSCGRQRDIIALAFSPEGTLAVGTEDGTIHLFGLEAGTLNPSKTVAAHAAAIYGLAWSPDGRRLASAGGDGEVILWDAVLASRNPLPIPRSAHEVWSVAFSPDGRTLAAGSRDSVVRLWDSKSRELKQEFPDRNKGDSGHTGYVYGLAFSPDGETLASAGRDGLVILWSLRTGRPHARFNEADPVWAVAFAPANERAPGRLSPVLASGTNDGHIRFRRAATALNPPADPK